MSLPEASAPIPVLSNAEEAAYQRVLLMQRHRSGSGWFYWIAGLSMINTVAHLGGSTWQFLAGLGLTTFAELVAVQAGKDGGPVGNVLKALALIFALFMAGFFVLCGVMARKGKAWAYFTGMAVYVVDAAVLILFSEWFGLAFHAWALFQLWNGYKASKQLSEVTLPQPGAPDLEPEPTPAEG